MNLAQLKSVCEVADQSLSISKAADALFRTQSTITRQIQELEEELGVQIFTRRRNKVLGITAKGQELIALARRMVQDAETLKNLKSRKPPAQGPQLSISTTHTQACYVLPEMLAAMGDRHPELRFRILQGTPAECYRHVQKRQADVALCAEPENPPEELVTIPVFRVPWIAITPPGHPLLSLQRPLTAADITRYPLVINGQHYPVQMSVSKVFRASPDIRSMVALVSTNVEVCKALVRRGLGIAIILGAAYDRKRDRDLGRVEVSHLYEHHRINLVCRRGLDASEPIRAFVTRVAPWLASYDLAELLHGEPPHPVSGLPVFTGE